MNDYKSCLPKQESGYYIGPGYVAFHLLEILKNNFQYLLKFITVRKQDF